MVLQQSEISKKKQPPYRTPLYVPLPLFFFAFAILGCLDADPFRQRTQYGESRRECTRMHEKLYKLACI